jgi:hypothetical protein
VGSRACGSRLRKLAAPLFAGLILAGCAGPQPEPPPRDKSGVDMLHLSMGWPDSDVLFKKDPDDRSSFPVEVAVRELKEPMSGRIEVKGGFTRQFAKKAVLIKLKGDDTWRGEPRIVLNSEETDPSMMREYLAYDLMHALKAIAPQTQYTRLWINDKYEGLFVRIGWIDSGLFAKAGYGKDGILYEPRADNFCGDLSLASVQRPGNCYYQRAPKGIDDFGPIKKLVEDIDKQPVATFDKFLDQNFDSESVLNMLVLNGITSNGDTYNKNYFLYYAKNGKWVVEPFDFDLTFGRTFDMFQPFPRNILNTNFTYYYPFQLGAPNPLRDKVLANPVLWKRLQKKIEKLVDGAPDARDPASGWFTPEQMDERINKLRAQIRPALADDPFLREQSAQFNEETDALIHYGHARNQYLKRVILGRNDWVRDVGEAPLAAADQSLDLSDGFGYLLATLDVASPGRDGRIAAEVRRGRPELVPNGIDRDTCVQRTWLLTAKDTHQVVETSARLEYLQENVRSHELGQRLYNEYRLQLYARDGGSWRPMPTRVNTIANTVSTDLLQLPPGETVWMVACDKGAGNRTTASASGTRAQR